MHFLNCMELPRQGSLWILCNLLYPVSWSWRHHGDAIFLLSIDAISQSPSEEHGKTCKITVNALNARIFFSVGGPHAGDCAQKGFVAGSLDCVGYCRTFKDIQVPLKTKARGRERDLTSHVSACLSAQGAPHRAPQGALQGAPLGPCGELTDLEDGLRHQLEERL